MINQQEKVTIDLLKSMVPKWCHEGSLVFVENDTNHDEVGVIVDLFFVDPECISNSEYLELIEFDEWMVITVYSTSGILDYGLDELKNYYK